ncbi:hypothetical protein Tco_1036310 [Tanacetum coccineum]
MSTSRSSHKVYVEEDCQPSSDVKDYYTIKYDTPLVNVYTTGEVIVRGMLIPNDLLTDAIRDTQAYKDYEAKYRGVEVPMIQPEPDESTRGTHRTPTATRIPNLLDPCFKQIVAVVEKQMLEEDMENLVDGEEESDGTEFADTVFLSDEDSGDRLEPVSHKENPENNDDEDDDEKKKDAKKDDYDDDHDDHALFKT